MRIVTLVQRGVNIYGVSIALAGSVTRRRLVDNRPPVTDRRRAEPWKDLRRRVLESGSIRLVVYPTPGGAQLNDRENHDDDKQNPRQSRCVAHVQILEKDVE